MLCISLQTFLHSSSKLKCSNPWLVFAVFFGFETILAMPCLQPSCRLAPFASIQPARPASQQIVWRAGPASSASTSRGGTGAAERPSQQRHIRGARTKQKSLTTNHHIPNSKFYQIHQSGKHDSHHNLFLFPSSIYQLYFYGKFSPILRVKSKMKIFTEI